MTQGGCGSTKFELIWLIKVYDIRGRNEIWYPYTNQTMHGQINATGFQALHHYGKGEWVSDLV